MDRLGTLDAEFLHLEDGVAHMHIAGACVFADPPPSFDDVSRLVAGKLHLIPRYRQRVRGVPFELGRPVWVDDPHFDLGYHLRHTALPAPGDDAAFCRLMGRLMSLPLDRERPLWETWLVEGLEGGRWALVFKIHHCHGRRHRRRRAARRAARHRARHHGDGSGAMEAAARAARRREGARRVGWPGH